MANEEMSQIHERARRYCISHLAGCYSRCVEWKGEGSREVSDWLEAEKHVQAHGQEWVDEIAKVIEDGPNVTDEELDVKFGRYLFHFSQSLRGFLPRPPYGKITFF